MDLMELQRFLKGIDLLYLTVCIFEFPE